MAVIVAAGTARKLGAALAAREDLEAPDETEVPVPSQLAATAGDEAS